MSLYVTNQPAVRFVVEVVSSAHDRNGNRYHYAIITSTQTGKRLVIADIGGTGNAQSLLAKHCEAFGFPAILTFETVHPKKRWKQLATHVCGDAPYEHQVTAKQLRTLEQAAQ